jgi:hypothetical protein
VQAFARDAPSLTGQDPSEGFEGFDLLKPSCDGSVLSSGSRNSEMGLATDEYCAMLNLKDFDLLKYEKSMSGESETGIPVFTDVDNGDEVYFSPASTSAIAYSTGDPLPPRAAPRVCLLSEHNLYFLLFRRPPRGLPKPIRVSECEVLGGTCPECLGACICASSIAEHRPFYAQL